MGYFKKMSKNKISALISWYALSGYKKYFTFEDLKDLPLEKIKKLTRGNILKGYKEGRFTFKDLDEQDFSIERTAIMTLNKKERKKNDQKISTKQEDVRNEQNIDNKQYNEDDSFKSYSEEEYEIEQDEALKKTGLNVNKEQDNQDYFDFDEEEEDFVGNIKQNINNNNLENEKLDKKDDNFSEQNDKEEIQIEQNFENSDVSNDNEDIITTKKETNTLSLSEDHLAFLESKSVTEDMLRKLDDRVVDNLVILTNEGMRKLWDDYQIDFSTIIQELIPQDDSKEDTVAKNESKGYISSIWGLGKSTFGFGISTVKYVGNTVKNKVWGESEENEGTKLFKKLIKLELVGYMKLMNIVSDDAKEFYDLFKKDQVLEIMNKFAELTAVRVEEIINISRIFNIFGDKKFSVFKTLAELKFTRMKALTSEDAIKMYKVLKDQIGKYNPEGVEDVLSDLFNKLCVLDVEQIQAITSMGDTTEDDKTMYVLFDNLLKVDAEKIIVLTSNEAREVYGEFPDKVSQFFEGIKNKEINKMKHIISNILKSKEYIKEGYLSFSSMFKIKDKTINGNEAKDGLYKEDIEYNQKQIKESVSSEKFYVEEKALDKNSVSSALESWRKADKQKEFVGIVVVTNEAGKKHAVTLHADRLGEQGKHLKVTIVDPLSRSEFKQAIHKLVEQIKVSGVVYTEFSGRQDAGHGTCADTSLMQLMEMCHKDEAPEGKKASVEISFDSSSVDEKLLAQIEHYAQTGVMFDTLEQAVDSGDVIFTMNTLGADQNGGNNGEFVLTAGSYQDNPQLSLEAVNELLQHHAQDGSL